jgi:hypothetical protein
VLKDRPAYSLLKVGRWWIEFRYHGAIANARRIWRAKGGQSYVSNPRYQHALEPLADLFSIEGVLVTGAVTDKFANQLQTAIVAKGPGISRLPAMVEYCRSRSDFADYPVPIPVVLPPPAYPLFLLSIPPCSPLITYIFLMYI